MRFPARIAFLVLAAVACLMGSLAAQAQTLPTPSAPILVVNDSTSSDPYQGFVPELLTTEGLNEFQVAQLSQLTSSFLANYDVVVLPHLTLTSTQATMFQTYVNNGGTLVGFRPDQQLAAVFGVSPKGTTLTEGWVAINTSTAYGSGLATSVMKFHGTADLYTLGSGTSLATLYSHSTTATTSPAAVRNQYGNGQAVLFAYDLTQTIVLMRQGNPAWAGYPNTHDGQVVMRPSQMFMDQSSGQFWNDLGNGALNDVPQADEQMRLFSNAVVLTNAAKRPLPKLWYFPNQDRALLLMTGDHHGDAASNSTNEESTIHAAGGYFSEFMWNPYNVINNSTAMGFVQAGDSLGIHFNDTAETDSSGIGGSHVTWNGMQSLISSSMLNYASVYPNAPAPVTTRDHYLIWLSNNASGAPDQTAQAELFQNFGIQLDTTFSAFPNRWGYMTGSGLPMKFLNTSTGSVISVYEQATQYEDDVQLSNDAYSMQWTLSQAQSHYQQTLSDSMNKYNTVITVLFHPDHWITGASDGGPYQPYAQTMLNYAQANSVPMSTTGSWLSFWQARAATTISEPSFTSNVLSFTATGAPSGLTLLVPNASGNKVVSSMTVDGTGTSFAVGTYQGVAYASTVLGAGTHNISVTYAAPGASISGTISPSSAASSTSVQLQQGGPGGPVVQTVSPNANGAYSFASLPADTYVVTPSSPSNTFSPASSTVTVNTSNITGVNFTASAVSNGETLFTTQTPGLVNNTDGPWELGTAFTSDTQGYITAIRFWKDSNETGAHNGHLWSSSGQLLASVTFTNETASGWQQQTLTTPVQIAANTTYVVSVNTANTYVATSAGLSSQVVNQDLSSVVGNNGLIGSPNTFPTASFNGTNYFRDVVFVPTGFALSGTITPSSLSSGSTVTLSGTSSATAIVNASGAYNFVGVPNGTYSVAPSGPGLSFSPASQAVTISSASKTGINFTALQTYSISGSITPASVGAGATVTLSGNSSATATADSNGNFTFTGLVNGSYTVTPSIANAIFSPTSQPVTINGANGTANFTATQTYSISGTISPASSGTGATVTLGGAASKTATADSNGNYTFSGLTNGAYTVTPGKSGFTFAPSSQNITLSGSNATGVNFVSLSASGTLSINATVSKDQNSSSTTVTTGTFSTTSANTLLLAFISSDGPSSGTNTTVNSVTGGSLTWALVLRTNAQAGTAEIWRAFATSTLTNATVTATFSRSVASSITVMAFAGVDTTGTNGSGAIGATKSASASTGAPSASLTTTRNGSWVLGVGTDWDNATARTVGSNQTMVHQLLSTFGDTYWVQRQNAATPLSGTSVTINDTAPTTDRYDLSIVEVLPALGTTATSTISGSITPAAAGSGATVVLNGPESGSTTADSNGNYSFPTVANGSYTITPSNPGYVFNPASVSVTVNGSNVTAPTITGTQVYSISGTISPAASGSGATVTLSGPSSATTTADSNGNYSFTGLANGNYTVAPSKTGVTFAPSSLAVTISNANSTGNNFTAGQTYSISGTITPTTGGSSATVTLTGSASATVTADSNGNYTFSGLANGSYTVTPTKTGYTFNPTSANVSVSGANVTVSPFTATAVITISGTLSPASAGTGATVALSGTATASTTADANGNYSFTVTANGPYTVTPTKTGVVFTPTSQNVTINNTSATANFTAGQTYTISGAITPAASSTGATVSVTGTATGTATVDANGNYSIAGLPAGTYTVTPTKSGFVFTPASATVTISTANVTQDFTAAAGFSISGTISPIFGGAGTNVSLSGSAVATTTTDSNGNYSFIGLPAGTYTVAPVSNAFTFAPSSTTVTISTANVVANFIATSAANGETIFTTQTPAGSSNDANYELGTAFTADVQGKITAIRFWKANGETGTHTGNLWSSTGQLLASVTFTNETVSGWQQQTLPTAVNIAANTTYIVSVNTTNSMYVNTSGGLATAIVNQDLSTIVGSNGVFGSAGTFPTNSFSNTNYFRDVAFTPTAFPISGTVSTAANGAGTTLTLSGAGTGTATADANGNFSFSPMPNGAYTITPSKSGFIFSPASQSVTISNGAVTGVAFTATPVFTISGTITPTATANGTTVTLSGTSTGTVTVGANGTYTFSNLVAGSYTVTPSKSGFSYTPTSTNVTLSNANATADFTIAAQTFTISGNISGSGGNGASVALSGTATATTTADSSGNYSFTGVANGSYTVTPSKSGFLFSPASANVTVNNTNPAAVNFSSSPSGGTGIAADITASKDNGTASTTVVSPAFTTAGANELLLAFISADNNSGTTTVSSVSGGGLTWTLVQRTNAQKGTAEIWKAFATAKLSNVSVTATLSQSVASSMTIMAFTGVNTSTPVGATGTGNGSSGAPTASLTTTASNSWVVGVGTDWDNATARTVGPNQTIVHQYLAPAGDTYWVQRSTLTPSAGTVVTINDTAPTTDRWDLSICEIVAGP